MWWGLMKMWLTTSWKKKDFTEHSGSSQRKEFRSPFPWGPQIKIETKHTKRKCRFLGGKSPMLHLEARIKRQLFKLLLHVLLFKYSRFWDRNLIHGTHSMLLLEKGIHVQFHKQPHPPEPKLARKILNFRTSCAVLSSVIFPHTQTDK